MSFVKMRTLVQVRWSRILPGAGSRAPGHLDVRLPASGTERIDKCGVLRHAVGGSLLPKPSGTSPVARGVYREASEKHACFSISASRTFF